LIVVFFWFLEGILRRHDCEVSLEPRTSTRHGTRHQVLQRLPTTQPGASAASSGLLQLQDKTRQPKLKI